MSRGSVFPLHIERMYHNKTEPGRRMSYKTASVPSEDCVNAQADLKLR